jgi:Tol biopolymer transport system component
MSVARLLPYLGLLVACGALVSQPASAASTELVSVDSAEVKGDGGSYDAAVSADGRYVAFHSSATNLVADDTNGQTDIFVRDRQSGTTERVSVDSAGIQSNNATYGPKISADGRYVAFQSFASNLVANDTNGVYDIFVHDRDTGMTERVSVDSAGEQSAGSSYDPSLSADGRYVAFSSYGDLVDDDTNAEGDIFVRDRQTDTTERVSIDSAGAEGNDNSFDPSISADGRYVAFRSYASNLVAGDTHYREDIFVHDRQHATTKRVSVDNLGREADDDSSGPSISADGRFVAFQSNAANLVAGDTDFTSDIFVRDLQTEPRNDLLVDFGGAGLWQRLNNTTWQKIHNASPAMIGPGDLNGSLKDEAIASFNGAGLWARYDNTTWVKLHNAVPKRFVAGDFDGNGMDDLAVDFGSLGIWVKRNNGAWAKLHNGTSQDLAAGDLDGNGQDELIVDFGAAGLWARYNDATWVKLHYASPSHIAIGDLDGNKQDEIVGDFGALGLLAFFNNDTWALLHNGTSQGLATGDLDGNGDDELVVDFGAAGLWVRYKAKIWAKLHAASPQRMLAADLDDDGRSDLVVDFGGAGLWVRYNNATWMKIHNASTQDLAAGGFD